MKSRLLRIVFVGLLTFGAFYLPSIATVEVSAQASQDFTLVNKTSVEIHALYVSPHSINEWECVCPHFLNFPVFFTVHSWLK